MKSQVDQLRKWCKQAYEQHQYETAEQIGDKVLALTNSSDDAYRQAQTFYARGFYLRAAQLLTSREDHLKSTKARYLVGLSLIAAEKYEDALAMVSDTAMDAQADTESESMDSDDNEDEPGASPRALLHYLEGQIHTLQNNYERAKAAYTRAVTTDPRCYDAYAQLVGHQLMSSSEQRKLIAGLDFSMLGANADLVKALYVVRMSKASDLEMVNDALSTLDEEYDFKDNVDLKIIRSDILLIHCRYTECRDLCEDALALDPHNYSIYPNYLTCLQELKCLNKLFEVAHTLARECPDEAVSWLAVGIYYFTKGNLSDARRYFSKASIMEPYCAAAWLGFAHTFAQEGEYEQAITAYSTTARLFPGSHLPYLFLGMQHLHLNNLSLAGEYLMTSFFICDNDPLLLNEIGVVHYNKNELDRAREFLEKALEIANTLDSDPESWLCIHSNLGFVYRRLGDYTTSLQYFNHVLRSSKQDPSILSAAALVHMQMGEPDKAILRLNQALSLSRNDSITLDLFSRAIEEASHSFDPEIVLEHPQLSLDDIIGETDAMTQD